LVIPDLQGFEEKRKVMNAACTAQPAVIVVPNFDQDVSTIIKAAKANNIELSVRSGGHSYTCTNIKEGGLHMDMRLEYLELEEYKSWVYRSFNKLEMVDTSLSPTGKALKLGPGRVWGDVLEFAPPTKYSYPHGQCRSVGVGGYLLGGGVNWLGTYNKYGYGAEHVLKMKVRIMGRKASFYSNIS
jgi:FAD/FMN-containing dehydrogenase